MFNVIRTTTVPASLVNRSCYRAKDVVETLEKDFHKKCYLCETLEPQDINVEHFIAHQNDPDLMYDWKNLYLSCGRCNNIKLRYFNNLLDCCDNNQDVFREIKLLPPRTPGVKKLVVQRQSAAEKTIETEKLLEKIYNSEHTINKSVTGSYLRKKIFIQFSKFFGYVTTYMDTEELPEKRSEALEYIKVLISNESQYSAFIKWCVLEDEYLSKQLGALIN